MAVRKILSYFEHKDRLRKKSLPVRNFDHRTKALIRDLKDTLHGSANGVGLAAPQINVHLRVVVVCLVGSDAETYESGLSTALVNPKIISAADERKDFDGCLSFPGLYGETVRPHSLRVTGLDEAGEHFDNEYEGFDALVVHHEIDHLDGVLFIDRIAQIEDLYRIQKTEQGDFVKVPLEGLVF
jgi:peptide deformylase